MTLATQIVLRWPGGEVAISTRSTGTMLDAMLARGIPVANSCRRGDCRQCVARVVESADPSCDPGAVVELCGLPASMVGMFELDDDPYQAAAAARLYPAKVVHVTEVASSVVRLRLRIPPKKPFEFKGGQYASLVLKSGLARNYSIASADSATGEVDFYIKIVNGGAFGGWLLERASPGELLQMRAPFGAFTLRPVAANSAWFVATGTGIVPIIAMLRDAGPPGMAKFGRADVVWGNRTGDDIFLRTELVDLCRNLGVGLRTVFSREESGAASRVTDVLERSELANSVIYASGHPDMVRDVGAIWSRGACKSGRFFSDAFAFADQRQIQRAGE